MPTASVINVDSIGESRYTSTSWRCCDAWNIFCGNVVVVLCFIGGAMDVRIHQKSARDNRKWTTKNHYPKGESIPSHLLSRQVFLFTTKASRTGPVPLAFKASIMSTVHCTTGATLCQYVVLNMGRKLGENKLCFSPTTAFSLMTDKPLIALYIDLLCVWKT